MYTKSMDNFLGRNVVHEAAGNGTFYLGDRRCVVGAQPRGGNPSMVFCEDYGELVT